MNVEIFINLSILLKNNMGKKYLKKVKKGAVYFGKVVTWPVRWPIDKLAKKSADFLVDHKLINLHKRHVPCKRLPSGTNDLLALLSSMKRDFKAKNWEGLEETLNEFNEVTGKDFTVDYMTKKRINKWYKKTEKYGKNEYNRGVLESLKNEVYN